MIHIQLRLIINGVNIMQAQPSYCMCTISCPFFQDFLLNQQITTVVSNSKVMWFFLVCWVFLAARFHMCGHTHAHRLISLTVFLQYYEPLLSLSRETCSYIYNANVSVLCFPSKACLCSPVFLRIIRTAVLLWPGQCRETSYYVSCLYMVEFKPVLLFSKLSIS